MVCFTNDDILDSMKYSLSKILLKLIFLPTTILLGRTKQFKIFFQIKSLSSIRIGSYISRPGFKIYKIIITSHR